MSVPFGRFGLLVQRCILQHLDPSDVFSFSLISERTKAISIYCHNKVGCATWQFNEIDYSIELSSTTSSESWILRIPSEYTGDVEDQIASLTFNGTPHPIYQIDDNHLQVAPGALTMCERIRLFEHVTKYLFDVFRIQDCHLKARILNRAEFVSRYTDQLKSLEIPDTVTKSQFQRILMSLKIEELKIQKEGVKPRLKFSGRLNIKSLISDDLNWLVGQNMMKLNCESILLNTDCLSNDKLALAIKKWTTGRWENLVKFEVRGTFRRDRMNQILRDASRVPVDANGQPIDGNNRVYQRRNLAKARVNATGFIFEPFLKNQQRPRPRPRIMN